MANVVDQRSSGYASGVFESSSHIIRESSLIIGLYHHTIDQL